MTELMATATTTDTTTKDVVEIEVVKSDVRRLASDKKEESITSMCYNDETQEITISVSDTAMADSIQVFAFDSYLLSSDDVFLWSTLTPYYVEINMVASKSSSTYTSFANTPPFF